MLIATVAGLPIGIGAAALTFADPVLLGAGIGVGISSSVIPYVCDQFAMSRLPRATFALLLSLLPATATLIGFLVLRQVPSLAELSATSDCTERSSFPPSCSRSARAPTPSEFRGKAWVLGLRRA